MKRHRKHKTVRTAIKAERSADVDVLIRPLIDWMNRMAGVTTLFCCQGGRTRYRQGIAQPGPAGEHPYVSFLCDRKSDLVTILVAFGAQTPVVVEWFERDDDSGWKGELGTFQYYARFHNQSELLALMVRLGLLANEPEIAAEAARQPMMKRDWRSAQRQRKRTAKGAKA